MLQQTARRVPATQMFGTPMLIAGAEQADEIEFQLGAIGTEPGTLILEPCARNTAPAIALAALAVPSDTLLLVMPSDHVIADAASFRAGVDRAIGLAQEGWLITFGIQPSRPETGYGYIQMGDTLAPGICRADRFVEKPDLTRAQAFLETGGFAWNAGIFLFRAKALLDALAAHAPDVLAATSAAFRDRRADGKRIHPAAEAFAQAPSVSIDRAVMEKAERIAVVPLDIGWSDVGSWEALYEVGAKDEQGNVVVGDGLLIDSRDCLIHSEGPKVVTIGVHELVVAVSGGCVLVMPRSESQRVREAVALIEAAEGAAG